MAGLTQTDVEELKEDVGGVFSQRDIEVLYKRFRNLDRGRKGFITNEELLGLPELSINPVASRIVRLFESVNFKDFVRLLAPFSKHASREQKIDCMFEVYDVDGNGIVSSEDMHIMLRQLAGGTLSDEELTTLIEKVLHAANRPNGLDQQAFRLALKDADLSNMTLDIPGY